jgi:phytoene dehydrogenase-like protein
VSRRAELLARRWDAVVVGAGHNGLACAAYLARGGRRVVVLERRPIVGGAAAIEEPWPGYRVSPCAYLAGLLHPRVIEDLDLRRHGLRVSLLDPQMFVPVEPGISLVEWRDLDRTLDGLRRWAPDQVPGYRAMSEFWQEINLALRPPDATDVWLRPAPSREEIEARVGHDPARVRALFEESVVEHLSRFLTDERLVDALASQGIIGTNASPHDPGTAFIRYHHASGRLEGGSGDWGFVHGGIGMVSETLRSAAEEAGAVVLTDAEVAAVLPGRGVELVSGETVAARAVVANADPRRTLGLIHPDEVPSEFARRVEAWPTGGRSAKFNAALSALPVFNGDPISSRGQVDVGPGAAGLHASHRAAARGEMGEVWAELYFQTAYDPSVAPAGKHVMSAFVQYVPYRWADGRSWDEHRSEVAAAVTAAIERWSPGFASLVEAIEVSGPPDIEAKIGLTGGHIFQGDCLPEFMFDRRMPYATPVEGVYLCGAATHPGGSVIGVNGRNAALRVLDDLDRTASTAGVR